MSGLLKRRYKTLVNNVEKYWCVYINNIVYFLVNCFILQFILQWICR